MSCPALGSTTAPSGSTRCRWPPYCLAITSSGNTHGPVRKVSAGRSAATSPAVASVANSRRPDVPPRAHTHQAVENETRPQQSWLHRSFPPRRDDYPPEYNEPCGQRRAARQRAREEPGAASARQRPPARRSGRRRRPVRVRERWDGTPRTQLAAGHALCDTRPNSVRRRAPQPQPSTAVAWFDAPSSTGTRLRRSPHVRAPGEIQPVTSRMGDPIPQLPQSVQRLMGRDARQYRAVRRRATQRRGRRCDNCSMAIITRCCGIDSAVPA